MTMAFAVKDGVPSTRFETHDSASMLFRHVDIDLADYPMVEWRWHIELPIRRPLERHQPSDCRKGLIDPGINALVSVFSRDGHPPGNHSICAFETLTIRLPQLVGCGHRYDLDRLGLRLLKIFNQCRKQFTEPAFASDRDQLVEIASIALKRNNNLFVIRLVWLCFVHRLPP
jgi:hypothetical protein